MGRSNAECKSNSGNSERVISNQEKGKGKCQYQQGCILIIGPIHGIFSSNFQGGINQEIEGEVEGYDEINMWLNDNKLLKVEHIATGFCDGELAVPMPVALPIPVI